MIKEIKETYNFKKIELKVNTYWNENNIYRKTRKLNQEMKTFLFIDGPPYTTGSIHLGTAWNKIMKDSILRYYSMNGNNIIDKPGWDMHGLPIEVKVEEKLGFKNKKDIERFGVSNFIKECKLFALENKKSMTLQFKKLGIWMNWDNPYMTLTDDYIESAWWIIKKIYENNLLTIGKRVVNWCPRCETAIADSEVEYFDKEDTSLYVKLKLKNKKNTYIIIWTTTPWTLPANIAVAVNPNYKYAIIEVFKSEKESEYLYVLESQIKFVLKIGKYLDKYNIIDSFLGKDLENIEYIPPIENELISTFKHKIVLASYVTNENTGCVHIATGHGVDDFFVGIKYNLPIICIMDSNGICNLKNNEYSGLDILDLNKKVIENLEKMDLLLTSKNIIHRYGHCWRCKASIIYRATEQWFIEISKLKENMLKKISEIKWNPEWAGSSRFKDWIMEARDWCISRQRYWGIPIPIWKCKNCENICVIGTKDELISMSNCNKDIELHRQYVDQLEFDCKCGNKMKRVDDIFDVWFDSAIASFATLEFPKKKDKFDLLWPADLILEGHDQTRGWFYSQLGASVAALDEKPYKSVLMHGFTLDSVGKKMSKSIGNVISPMHVADEFGVDVLRLYVLSSNAPWDDLKYNVDEIKNIYRTVNILWNVYKFPLPYMVLDKFEPQKYNLKDLFKNMKYEDKWILSRLQTLIINIGHNMESYSLHKVLRSLFNFILEDLSRWYIQLIRERTWTEKNTVDKETVYSCLYYVYTILTQLLAPFAPYITEEIYQSIIIQENEIKSIHMEAWPSADKYFLNEILEKQMDTIRNIVEIVSNSRQKIGRKLRWPIQQILIYPKNDFVISTIKKLKSVLLEQTNSKCIYLLENEEFWSESKINILPVKSELGPIYKEKSQKIYDYLIKIDGREILNKFLDCETINLEIEKENTINITKKMIQLEEKTPIDTILVETDYGKIYIDCRLNQDLKSEGYAREIIRRIQDMRKELYLSLNELIIINIKTENTSILDLLKIQVELIKSETRSIVCTFNKLKNDNNISLSKEWFIESDKFEIELSKD